MPKKLLGRLIEAATEELDLEIRSLGSRTCDRAAKVNLPTHTNV